MKFSFWQRKRPAEAGGGGHSELPQPGECVRVQALGLNSVGVYGARVRAVGLRRLFLDCEAVPDLQTTLTLEWARGDALYRFETRVVGPARPGALVVARPRRVTRVQRRQFYRLSLHAPTTFRVLTPEGRATTAPVPARLVDLSGGGALLAASKPVPGGLSVLVRVPFGDYGEVLDVESESLECRVATQGTARIYLIRLRFFGPPHLSDTDREEIVSYIAAQQRLLLRSRKLLRA